MPGAWVFQILDVFIVEYLHIYAEILGVGLNYKHEIHLCFYLPCTHSLKIILYSIFHLGFVCDRPHEIRCGISYVWCRVSTQKLSVFRALLLHGARPVRLLHCIMKGGSEQPDEESCRLRSRGS